MDWSIRRRFFNLTTTFTRKEDSTMLTRMNRITPLDEETMNTFGGTMSEGTTSKTPTVSVVVAALNEAENLPFVLPRIPEWVHEVLLVDGNSTDDTVAVARQVRPGIRVVRQEGRGKGAAIRTGFALATGDIVVLLDADGSTDPTEIPAFVATLVDGADFAKGSRFLKGGGTVDMPVYRQMGNWGFVVLTNLLFGTRYTDITYGYNATWRHHQESLALEIDGWANEIISNIRVARHGLNVVEVPSFEHERIAGEAKLATFSAGWTILKAIVSEAFNKSSKPSYEPQYQEVISQ
jgi:glycosyltransferase involved in cell wall biosynthesis